MTGYAMVEGSRKVVEQLHKIYPMHLYIPALLITDEWCKRLDNKIITGYFCKTGHLSKLRKFLPILRIRWFESLDLTDYDLIINSSGSAKGVKTLNQGLCT